ncbi:MAG: type I methionyl aminopeptidase [Candidatus Berkelbacteria bacterium]|nr:type I methionyl aminopeptidase [Candidatus Berkelbacteria bacterium]
MNILSSTQIEILKSCGKKLAETLFSIEKDLKPGISTKEIDNKIESKMAELKIRPSFKNYYVHGIGAFPAATCISINDEIVHGIPSKSRILKEGDIVSLDLGAELQGVYTDMAKTYGIGKISDKAKLLICETEKSLAKGIEEAVLGNHLGDVGNAIEKLAKESGLGVIREYVGHGIGTKPHLPPQIPNYGQKGSGPAIKEGMALAIEPMLTLGSEWTKVAKDNWTVHTIDGSLAAHFEHTIIIENGKPVIVTVV